MQCLPDLSSCLAEDLYLLYMSNLDKLLRCSTALGYALVSETNIHVDPCGFSVQGITVSRKWETLQSAKM